MNLLGKGDAELVRALRIGNGTPSVKNHEKGHG